MARHVSYLDFVHIGSAYTVFLKPVFIVVDDALSLRALR
jgi:hypothetical protein